MRRTAVFAIVCALVNLASAFNHPEIRWKSVTTAHFIINYYDHTEPAVYATWKIAEAAYQSLSQLYDYEARDKISISLADYDDYANGFASWTNGSIMIWVTDVRFDLRGNNTWLNNVVTHELSHIMTLEKKSKMQLFDWTFSFSYASKSDTLALTEPFATTRFFPEWVAEGIAQHESERRGNDCWDSKRDMLLRDAVACGKALSLDAMGHFNHDDYGNEMVYNQGFSFIKFIEQRVGTPNLTGIFNGGRNTALISDNFHSMFENQTGQSLEELYHQWLDSLKSACLKRMPQNPTQTKNVWNKGFYNFMPKISRDKKWWGWLTSYGDDFARTDLVIAPYGAFKPSVTFKWALSSWDFSADSRQVYFIKSRELSDNGSEFNDVYSGDLSTHQEQRLTHSGRIYDVAACPDGQSIACVQYRDGAFSIISAGTNGCCWKTLASGEIGRPFSGLSFSPVKTSVERALQDPALKKDSSSSRPDSAKNATANESTSPEYMVVTTRVTNGMGTICVVGTETKTVSMIGSGAAQEENPNWSKNGRIFFDADYDGTFNIYSMNPDGTGLSRHTDARFGMLYPFTDDSMLLCVTYAGQAFSIVSCGLSQGVPYTASRQNACAFSDLPRPKGEVTIKSRPYETKLLRPVWELQSACEVQDDNETFTKAIAQNRFNPWFDSTTLNLVTGIAMSREDALEKKSVTMGVMAAIIHSGATKDSAKSDTAANHYSALYRSRPADAVSWFPQSQGAGFPTLAERTAKSLMHNEQLIQRFMQGRNKTAATSATDSAGDSTGTQASWLPVLYPSFSYMNNDHLISFGLDADVMLLYFIPYVFQVQATATWQMDRDFYASCFPSIELVPLANLAVPDASLPLVFAYSTYGYLNTDVNYNESGITQVELLLQPETFIIANSSDSANSLSSQPRASLMTVGFSALHGFPITHYSSIVVSTRESYSGITDSLSDPNNLLPGYSTEYLTGDIGASLAFPLWRQINGGPAYADAWYFSVGYDLGIETNSTTLQGGVSKAFVKPSFDKDHVCVSHVFSAGTQLGFFKSYLFSRSLNVKGSWDVWKRKFSMNVVVGM